MTKPFKKDYVLTQGFGENPANYAQFGIKGHNGLDYGLPMGTEVLAPHSGKIIEATLDPKGYGLYVKIENDIEGSVLAHFKEFRVGVGDTVSEGQLIALSDTSGNSTGPHLHWGYYLFPRDRANGYAGFINQIDLIQNEAMAVISQKELDIMRSRRDELFNLLQAETEKNSELVKQLQDEQKSNVDLNDALTKITNQDKDYAEQLITAQKSLSNVKFDFEAVAKALETEAKLPDMLSKIDLLRKPTDDVAKEIIPVLEGFWQNLIKGKKTETIINKIFNLFIKRG